MLRLTPRRKPAPPAERTGKVYPAQGQRRGRVALLSGCVNPVLAPSINEAAIRLLNRHGIEVVVAAGEACCGSLAHHMGREERGAGAGAQQYRRLDARDRRRRARRHPDHGVRLRHHGQGLRLHAAHRPGLCRRRRRGFPRSPRTSPNIWRRSILPAGAAPRPLTVAYHAACSLQHGQKVDARAEGIALQVRLRGQRCAGRASVLRLGRHLQHPAAGAGGAVARPQGRQYRTARSRM